MREKSVITSYNQSGNVHSHELYKMQLQGTVQQEVQESKLDTNICKIVKHLEEEQKVLFQHLKKALAFGDEMQVAYSFSEKKVMRLERELDDKENEAIRTLQKLGKKEDLVFCLSERNNYYKREVHRLLLENSSLRQRVELLSKEVQEWKNKFDLPIYESSSRHKCQEDIRINPWNQVACNTEEVCTESQEESSIVTRL
ncbi:hypothetical protein R5R35_002763 [Gryllus longicercus]|uniref:Uncharacterized protein n=1 Tax=Gryllus longicercus TaxID=2509291 RepID=A0AAN9ZDN4_9ORTH